MYHLVSSLCGEEMVKEDKSTKQCSGGDCLVNSGCRKWSLWLRFWPLLIVILPNFDQFVSPAITHSVNAAKVEKITKENQTFVTFLVEKQIWNIILVVFSTISLITSTAIIIISVPKWHHDGYHQNPCHVPLLLHINGKDKERSGWCQSSSSSSVKLSPWLSLRLSSCPLLVVSTTAIVCFKCFFCLFV